MRNKRIISMLLTIAMIFTFIPMTMVTAVAAADVPANATFAPLAVDLGGTQMETSINSTNTNKYIMAYGAKTNPEAIVLTFEADRDLVSGTKYVFSFDIRTEVQGSGERYWRIWGNEVKVGGTGCNANKANTYLNSDTDSKSAYEWQPQFIEFTPKTTSKTVDVRINFGNNNTAQIEPFGIDNIKVYEAANPENGFFTEDFESAELTDTTAHRGASLTAGDVTIAVKEEFATPFAVLENPGVKAGYVTNDSNYAANKEAWDAAIAEYRSKGYHTELSAVNAKVMQEIEYEQVSINDGGGAVYIANTELPAGKYKLTATVRNDKYNMGVTETSGYSDGNWQSCYPSENSMNNSTPTGNSTKNKNNYGIETKYWLYDGNHYGKVFEDLNNFGLIPSIVTADDTIEADRVNLNYLWTEYEFEFEIESDTTLEEIVFSADHAKNGEKAYLGYQDIELVQLEAYNVTAPIDLVVKAPESVTVNKDDETELEVEVYATTKLIATQKLNALNFVVDYNDTALTIKEIETADEHLNSGSYGVQKVNGARYGWTALNGYSIEVDKGEEVLVATITFTVSDSAEADSYKIDLVSGTPADEDDNDYTRLNAKLDGTSTSFKPGVTAAEVEIINKAAVTIEADPENGGSVSESSADALVGSVITVDEDGILCIGELEITAENKDNFSFLGWYIGETIIGDEGYLVASNADITITAKFDAEAQVTIVNGKDEPTDIGSVTNITDTIGGALQFTVNEPDDGNTYITTVTAKDGETELTLTNEGNIWTSDEVLTGVASITVKFAKVTEVILEADTNAGITETKYYILEGTDGLFNSAECDDKVAELPEIVPVENDTDRYVLADNTNIWLVDEEAMTEVDAIAAIINGATTIKANIKKQYLLTFVIDADSEEILDFVNTEDETLWADEGAENLTFPTLSRTNNYYVVEWYDEEDGLVTVPAKVEDSATYTAKAKAQSIAHEVEYYNANGNTVLDVTEEQEAAVVGDLGDKLTITPKTITGYVVESVTATVGDDELTLTANSDNTVWTSDNELEGPANVIIKYRKYYEVKFVNNDHAFVNATYFAKDGDSGFYTDTTFGTKITADTLPEVTYTEATTDTQYVANTTTPWLVGDEGKTADDIVNATYTDVAEIMPAYVTEYLVNYVVAEGSENIIAIDGITSEWVASGETPAGTGYKFIDEAVKDYYTVTEPTLEPVEGPTEYSYTATPNSYDVEVTADDGVVEITDGVTANKATYGDDVVFTVDVTNEVTVNVTIGGQPIADDKLTSSEAVENKVTYTIAGDAVTGAIAITATQKLEITITAVDGCDFDTQVIKVDYNGKLDAAAIDALTVKAGYTFEGWLVGDAQEAISTDELKEMTFTAATTVKAVVTENTYTMKVPAGVSVTVNDGAAVDGGENITVNVKVSDAVVITPNENVMVTGVFYNGNSITASEGKYPVPAGVITEDIEITVTTITYSFIEYAEHRAISSDTKILMIPSEDANLLYEYSDCEFYYSNVYKAYLAIIGKDLTAAKIGQTIKVRAAAEGEEATVIKHNGDVNGDNMVTAADAAIVSEILHHYNSEGSTTYNTEYDDLMRLEADVINTLDNENDSAYVTASDCYWILSKSVGNTYPEQENDPQA